MLKAVTEYLYVLDAKARRLVCYGPLVLEKKWLQGKTKLSVELKQIYFRIGKELKADLDKTDKYLFSSPTLNFAHAAAPCWLSHCTFHLSPDSRTLR